MTLADKVALIVFSILIGIAVLCLMVHLLFSILGLFATLVGAWVIQYFRKREGKQ